MSDATRDGLGARMKSQYEDRTRYMLPRRTYTVIRCDGRAFHTITRKATKPFDQLFHSMMVKAAIALAKEVQGVKIGYVQSDEISIVATDFDRVETEAWFDGNIQKVVSIAASVVTRAFPWDGAHFDARAFTIPDPVEVENYLIWRQKDAIRNSVSSLAQCYFSPAELYGRKQDDMLNMLIGRGVHWDNQPIHVQRGTVVFQHPEWGWLPDYEAPVFTDDSERAYLRNLLRPKADV